MVERAVVARFQQLLVRQANGCLLFMGSTGTHDGYGLFTPGPGKKPVVPHRWWYELHKGKLAPGMDLGHVCHDDAVVAGTCDGGPDCPHRRCCNLAHLEPQTRSENTLAQNHFQRNKTHCPRGHLLGEPGKDGKRRCQICRREQRQSRGSGSGGSSIG